METPLSRLVLCVVCQSPKKRREVADSLFPLLHVV